MDARARVGREPFDGRVGSQKECGAVATREQRNEDRLMSSADTREEAMLKNCEKRTGFRGYWPGSGRDVVEK